MCGHANSCDRIRCSKSDSIQLPSCLLHELPSSPAAACSTSFTTAGYGSHQNVFIRLDPLGRPPSATGSYATIASLNKYPTETKKSCSIFDRKSANYLCPPFAPFRFNPIGYKLLNVLSLLSTGFRSSPTPTPYATALLPMGDQAGETIYSKPESVCPSRISYYASSQLTQVSLAFAHLSLISMAPQGGFEPRLARPEPQVNQIL